MNEEKPVDLRENLSALVDGEASDWDVRKTLQESEQDHSLREDWAAYQMIGSVLRKEAAQGIDISASVMSAIEQEPAQSKIHYFSKAITQTAIAASVAAVAFVGIQQYQIAGTDPASVPNVAEVGVQSEMMPLGQPPAGFDIQPTRAVDYSTVEPSFTQGTTVQIPVDRDQMKAHLDNLVQEHSQNSVRSTQGVMPMVRVPEPTEAE